jgi:cell division protein FtsW
MPVHQEVFRSGRFDKVLFMAAFVLIAAGMMMVYSSSSYNAGDKYGNSFHFVVQQMIGLAVGLALLVFFLRVPRPVYKTPQVVFGLMLITLVLLLACFGMPTFANTNRLIQLGAFRFQPSELAKVSLILFLAYIIDKKQDRLKGFRSLALPVGGLLAVVLLIIKEPDYGTAALVFFIGLTLLVLGGMKSKFLIILCLIALIIFSAYLLSAPYRWERFLTFLFPDHDPQGAGFQIRQSKLAVGRGGLFGVSLGESTQKLYFLPCAHTDFIYAIIGEEFGLLGTLGMLAVFILILWRGMVIARRAPDTFSRIAAAGLTLMITAQALINITVVLGLGPVKGIPLPLVSYGRSSMICTLLAVGILLHISQRKAYGGNP